MKRIVSGIMFTLLLTSMLAFVIKIQPVKAEWGELEVTVAPEHPGVSDLVNVTVSFTFSTMPPGVEEFSPLNRVGNTFLVNVAHACSYHEEGKGNK